MTESRLRPSSLLQPRSAAAGALLVFLATAAFWSPSLANQFVWDDFANLVDSTRLRPWSALWEAFLHDANWSADKTQASVGTYRPVSLALLAFGTHLGGAPWPHHLINVLLHAGTAAALYVFLRRWIEPATHALTLTLLWAVHPACVEPVAWINGLSEPAALLPGLGALTMCSRSGVAARLWTTVLLLFALLGKESGLVFLPLAVYFAGRASAPDLRLRAWRGAALSGVVAMALWLGMRSLALSGGPLPGVKTNVSALLLAPAVWMRALRAALLPVEQGLLTLNTWLADLGTLELVAYTVAIALIIAVAAAAWRSGERLAAVGLAWFLVALAPACLLAPTGWPGLYRWIYLGLPGLLLAGHALIGRALSAGLMTPRTLGVSTACVGLAFAVQTQRGIAVWHDDGSLFTQMIIEQPEESYGYTGLASHLLRIDRPELALPVVTEGARIDREGRPVTFGLLATSQARVGDCAAAVATLNARFKPGSFPPYALEHTGLCFLRAGDEAPARAQFERCREQGNACAGHLARFKPAP